MEELKQIITDGIDTSDVLFLLDDGHGWETDGKRSGDFDRDGWPDIKENAFNDAVMRKFSMVLEIMGFRYELLAPEYWDVPLWIRSQRERSYSKSSKLTIMMSFHANAFTSDKANGVEVFYREGNAEGGRLGSYLIQSYRGLEGMTNRGLKISNKKQNNFHMLRKTTSTARVLIEAGFMTNAEDRKRLNDDHWINEFCCKTLIGSMDYLRSFGNTQSMWWINHS